ncbi:MAG: hypothetical protein KY444_05335 [Gemmatimonadetes bacterium]|nr:hypothetical protein [Gemmatimonadota bacterium]
MQTSAADGHLSDGEIVQLVDGVLAGPGRERADAHLAGCHACGGRLRQVRTRSARLTHLLAEADWPLPPARVPDELSVRRTRRTLWLRIAAGVLLLVSAGAVASPLRARMLGWVSDGWAWIAEEEVRPSRTNATTPPAPAASAARVSFVPAGGVLTLEFDHAGPGRTVELAPSGSASAVVEQVGGTSPVELLMIPHESRVRVRNGPADASDYRVRVPDGAERVRIRVRGRPTVTLTRAQLADGERVPLGGS